MSKKIDAALQRNDNQRVYFFIGEQLYRYNLELVDKVDPNFPQPVKEYWTGLPYSTVDAVIKANHADKLYFFKDDYYLRYDINDLKVDAGYPRKIKEGWVGVPFDTVDAAFWRLKLFVDIEKEVFEKVYLFKGEEYVVYNIDTDQIADGYPKAIKDGFPGMPFATIDAIFQRYEQHLLYIFKDDKYLIYDIEAKRTLDGYPHNVVDDFKGIVL